MILRDIKNSTRTNVMFLYITFDVSRLEGQAAVSVHTNPLTTATILVIRNHTTAITRQLQYFSDWPLMTSYRSNTMKPECFGLQGLQTPTALY